MGGSDLKVWSDQRLVVREKNRWTTGALTCGVEVIIQLKNTVALGPTEGWEDPGGGQA